MTKILTLLILVLVFAASPLNVSAADLSESKATKAEAIKPDTIKANSAQANLTQANSAQTNSTQANSMQTNLTQANLTQAGDTIPVIRLHECYEWAIQNSTLAAKNQSNIDISTSSKKEAYGVYIPSISLNGMASYQSDVVSIDMPGIELPRKENYSLSLDVVQSLYNGGIASKKTKLAQETLGAEHLKLKVEQLALKDKVSSLFLGITLLKSNEHVLHLNLDILNRNLKKMNQLYAHGAVQRSDILELESELLKANQSLALNRSDQNKMVEMLSILTGKSLDQKANFVIPQDKFELVGQSSRPEYELFNAQNAILDQSIDIIQTKNLPKLSLFATGGNGLPGLNMLNRDPDWYYKAGVKLSVPLTNWKSTRYQKAALRSKKLLILDQKEDYEKQNTMLMTQTRHEVEKYENMITYDKIIVDKKKEIAEIDEVKLQKGIMTSSEYITTLNHYKEAMLSQTLHEIQLMQAILNYKSAIGQD